MLINFLKNGLFPRTCFVCSAETNKLSTYIITKHFCNHCLVEISQKSKLKRFQFKNLKHIDSSYYLWNYEQLFSTLIKKYKYQKTYFLAEVFSELLFLSLRNYLIINNLDTRWNLVCFVPSTKNSIKKKRFNHMHLLSRKISEKLELELGSNIIQNNTEKRHYQSRLNVRGRKRNMKNAFYAKNCKGRSILLLDDVCSTAASIEQAYNALYKAGAKNVDVLVLAYNKP